MWHDGLRKIRHFKIPNTKFQTKERNRNIIGDGHTSATWQNVHGLNGFMFASVLKTCVNWSALMLEKRSLENDEVLARDSWINPAKNMLVGWTGATWTRSCWLKRVGEKHWKKVGLWLPAGCSTLQRSDYERRLGSAKRGVVQGTRGTQRFA